MTPAGVITATSYISVVSMQFERYHALNRVRRCLLDCRRNVRSVITTKTSQSPLPSRMTPAGAVGGTRGCHRPFWSARGECWQPPMYFDMSNNPAIDVAKCSCVVMPHGHSQRPNTERNQYNSKICPNKSPMLEIRARGTEKMVG